MRVALCHDWLTGMRGGERVLESLAGMYPDARLYTLVHVRGATSPAIDALEIRASGLSRLPGAGRHYRKLLPLFPHAVERLRVAPCDLVLSSSHAFAKGIRAPEGVPHLCYCFTPMRWAWDQVDSYLGTGVQRRLAEPLLRSLRNWDRRTSGPDRVTDFAAISHTVADRVRRHYGRTARVLYPPVRTEFFERERGPRAEFYLMVGLSSLDAITPSRRTRPTRPDAQNERLGTDRAATSPPGNPFYPAHRRPTPSLQNLRPGVRRLRRRMTSTRRAPSGVRLRPAAPNPTDARSHPKAASRPIPREAESPPGEAPRTEPYAP